MSVEPLTYEAVFGSSANVSVNQRPHITSSNETLSGSNTRMRERMKVVKHCSPEQKLLDVDFQ